MHHDIGLGLKDWVGSNVYLGPNAELSLENYNAWVRFTYSELGNVMGGFLQVRNYNARVGKSLYTG